MTSTLRFPVAPVAPRAAHDRYDSEIAFFDREADRERTDLEGLDPLIVERFRRHARRRFNKELRVDLLRPLEGKRVLDVGCGGGEQATLLASLGAHVTGVDISPRSIAVARERAKIEGLSGRTRFVCAPIVQAELGSSQFDAIWCDGILHHLIPELEAVLDRIVEWAAPGARVIVTEPVNLSPALHKIRMMTPVPVEGTPDERPLEWTELDAIHRHLEGLRVWPYLLFGRVVKFLVPGGSYEHAAAWRRALVNTLLAADQFVLGIPAMWRFAGQLVLLGTVAKCSSPSA
jgi:2-polyprenyl-3-methyl-5-hydroxy-6-metoxy-1,4-benzoquinol methylase